MALNEMFIVIKNKAPWISYTPALVGSTYQNKRTAKSAVKMVVSNFT
jgi:hypothetical protein